MASDRSTRPGLAAQGHRDAIEWPARVVVIESPSRIATRKGSLREYRDAGLAIVRRADAASALIELARSEASAVVVPTDVIGMSAVEVTEIVRSLTATLVLVGLADQSHQSIAVDALAAGARGIVPLPVDAPRLAGEIRDARPTPTGAESSANGVVRGSIVLSWSEHRVTAAGAEVRLSPKEFEVLGYLLSRAPRIVSLRDLIDMFEGGDLDRAPRMRVTIAKIRSRLADAAPEIATIVQTVHGIGYRVDSSELREESARGDHPNLPET